MERLFFHLSGYVFGPALVFAVICLVSGDLECASIASGIAAACCVYWLAMYTKKDITRRD